MEIRIQTANNWIFSKKKHGSSSGSHVAGYLISSTVVHCVWVGCHVMIPVVKVSQNFMERYFFNNVFGDRNQRWIYMDLQSFISYISTPRDIAKISYIPKHSAEGSLKSSFKKNENPFRKNLGFFVLLDGNLPKIWSFCQGLQGSRPFLEGL